MDDKEILEMFGMLRDPSKLSEFERLGSLCKVVVCNNVPPSSSCGQCGIAEVVVRFFYPDGGYEDDRDNDLHLNYPQCAAFRNRQEGRCVVRLKGGIIYWNAAGGWLYKFEYTPKPPVECFNDLPEVPIELVCSGSATVIQAHENIQVSSEEYLDYASIYRRQQDVKKD